MAKLICRDLTIGYGNKTILKNINFEVNGGNYLCIVGENGSGKSTLLKTLLGLLAPIGGKVIFGDGLCRDELGYLPQQTDVQKDFPASVREIVLSGCQGRCGLRPFYSKDEKRLAKSAMDKLEIASLEKRCFRELSGGQRQRALLARALCGARKMLFLDEPVSGLDPKSTADMYGLVESINREDNIAVVMISHDIVSAVKYASHILHIGNNIFFGTKEEYIKSDIGRNYLKQGGGIEL